MTAAAVNGHPAPRRAAGSILIEVQHKAKRVEMMPYDEIHRELGALDARLAHVEKSTDKMSGKIDEVHDAIVTARGQWKALVFLTGAAATLGGLIVGFLAWFWPRP